MVRPTKLRACLDDGDTVVNDGCPLYLLADHLGGTTKVLNASGSVLSEQKYWPYGAVRSGGITQTDKLFTGQQDEPGGSALGLYNYKARFYSTTLGRFVSAVSWLMWFILPGGARPGLLPPESSPISLGASAVNPTRLVELFANPPVPVLFYLALAKYPPPHPGEADDGGFDPHG